MYISANISDMEICDVFGEGGGGGRVDGGIVRGIVEEGGGDLPILYNRGEGRRELTAH